MNPETGEVKKFDKKSMVPAGWINLPVPGEEVEVVAPPENKRGRKWKVVEILEGKPGRMVIEPTPETVRKSRPK